MKTDLGINISYAGVIMHCKFKTFNVGAGDCITLFWENGDKVKSVLNKHYYIGNVCTNHKSSLK